MGGPADDATLLWLVRHLELALGPLVFAFVCFAVLAASMSTGDALLHASGSMLVRDLCMGRLRLELESRAQVRTMRLGVVSFGRLAWSLFFPGLGSVKIVDLLLYAQALPMQFVQLVLLDMYWRRANRARHTGGWARARAWAASHSYSASAHRNSTPRGIRRTSTPASPRAQPILRAMLTAALTPQLPRTHPARFEPHAVAASPEE